MSIAGNDIAAGICIRPAKERDVPTLDRLIAASARKLSLGFYDQSEIEAAIAHVFGVDSDLVADGTYLVAEQQGELIGCGGWSRQRTLFGGDRFVAREAGFLDPAVDAARIRAFFVSPGHARKGVASKLLAACEAAAAAAGFSRVALMATLPGAPFYAGRGYTSGEPVNHLCGDVSVRFIRMEKELWLK